MRRAAVRASPSSWPRSTSTASLGRRGGRRGPPRSSTMQGRRRRPPGRSQGVRAARASTSRRRSASSSTPVRLASTRTSRPATSGHRWRSRSPAPAPAGARPRRTAPPLALNFISTTRSGSPARPITASSSWKRRTYARSPGGSRSASRIRSSRSGQALAQPGPHGRLDQPLARYRSPGSAAAPIDGGQRPDGSSPPGTPGRSIRTRSTRRTLTGGSHQRRGLACSHADPPHVAGGDDRPRWLAVPE